MQTASHELTDSEAWHTHARIGPYTLLAKLAVGGMAEIWLARQSGLKGFERVVVVKRIGDTYSKDPDFVEMFLDEARIAAQLNHPHVVQIHDLGEHAGAYFMAMEYLHGEDLATVARVGRAQDKPLPLGLAARIVAHAAEGLAYAHEKRGLDGKPLHLVHRDISPQNLFITYEGVVKILDFGIAKAANRTSHTVGNKFKGKLGYMSPEQARGKPLDARSDLFSLGVVLYEALTGTRLFSFDDPMAAIAAITGGDAIPAPSSRNALIPGDLDAIVMRALSRDAAARYPSARELQADLEAWLQTQAESPGSAELAAYMRGLFARKMEERARMIESARSGELTPSQLPKSLLAGTPASMPGGTAAEGDPAEDATRLDSPRAPRPARWIAGGVGLALVFVGALWWAFSAPAPCLLRIHTDPEGAAVSIDGRPRGASPLELLDLTPGEHAVEAELAGHAAVRRSLRLSHAGEHEELVLVLPTLPPPPPEPAPPAAAAPEPQPKLEPKPRPPVAREVPKGRLSLVTTPWTHVFLGARTLGDTPLEEVSLPAGKILLRLVNEEKKVDQTIQVDISPGKVTVKKLRL